MIIETELLRDYVHEQRFVARRKLIHASCPKWNREAKQEHGLDQDDGKFQMRRDAAPHPQMIGPRLPAFPESDQHVNKKCRPPNKKRPHEPMTELKNMIDLVTMR